MLRQSTCRLLAAVLVAALFGKASSQPDQLAPPGINVNAVLPADNSGTCSCDCCKVTARTVSQQVAGVTTACALDSGNTDSCPATCDNEDPASTVVQTPTGNMQYERFCFFNCLPVTDEIATACRTVSVEEQEQLLTSGGNGMDPAAVLGKPSAPRRPAELVDPDAPPEPPQLSDQQAMNDNANANAGDAAGAVVGGDGKDDKKDKDTGAMVAEASGKQAMAAGMEARITEAEAISAQSLSLANGDMQAAKSGALMVNAAKAQVAAAEVRAAIYAKSAARAAARAQEELKEIKDIPRKVAALAAEEAKSIVQKEVDEAAGNVLWVKSRLAGPGLPVPLAEAAVNAAKPYYAVMNKAIAMGNLYEANAHTAQDAAQTLQEQSRTVASQAVAYQMAGHGDMAKQLMAQAKGMLTEAQAKDAQAQKDMAVAEGVRKSVPNYQANAALASARATSIANPGGQPPPAVAPGFLIQRSADVKLHTGGSH